MNDQTPIDMTGHNKPPVYDAEALEGFRARAADLAEAAGQWADAGPIEDENQAGKAADFLASVRAAAKDLEDLRKKEKQPHLDAGRAVDDAFKAVAAIFDKATKLVKPLSEAYLRAKEEKARAEAEAARAAAAEERRRAEEAARQAEQRNDAVGMADAEKLLAEAEKAAEAASGATKVKVDSATGAGRAQALRTERVAVITNINQLFLHYRDREEVKDVLKRLAQADLRANKGEAVIPGIEIEERRKL